MWNFCEIGLEYIFLFGNMKYLFQPFLGNIKHDLRRAAGPPNKGDNLFHSCRLHWRIDYWTLHHLFKPFTWAGNIKSFLSSFYTTTFHLHEQWPYKHSSFFIFPDLFLRQTHKLLIWQFILFRTTCFSHQALVTCCLQLIKFEPTPQQLKLVLNHIQNQTEK